MTTYEHAMLGINGALAAGVHVHYGWKIVALAGVAAVAPDWDALPMLVDMAALEGGHRVWGHNLLACLIVGVVLGTIDYRWDVSGRIGRRLVKFGPTGEFEPHLEVRQEWSKAGWCVWMLVGWIAALSQIPADAVVSGGEGLSDWALEPLWPFSDQPLIYPMVPWGNVGVTVIFAFGTLALVRWNSRLQGVAVATLSCVIAYILVWGWLVR